MMKKQKRHINLLVYFVIFAVLFSCFVLLFYLLRVFSTGRLSEELAKPVLVSNNASDLDHPPFSNKRLISAKEAFEYVNLTANLTNGEYDFKLISMNNYVLANMSDENQTEDAGGKSYIWQLHDTQNSGEFITVVSMTDSGPYLVGLSRTVTQQLNQTNVSYITTWNLDSTDAYELFKKSKPSLNLSGKVLSFRLQNLNNKPVWIVYPCVAKDNCVLSQTTVIDAQTGDLINDTK